MDNQRSLLMLFYPCPHFIIPMFLKIDFFDVGAIILQSFQRCAISVNNTMTETYWGDREIYCRI